MPEAADELPSERYSSQARSAHTSGCSSGLLPEGRRGITARQHSCSMLSSSRGAAKKVFAADVMPSVWKPKGSVFKYSSSISFLLKRRSMRSAFHASLSFAASVRFFAGTTRRASCIVTVEAPLTLWAFRIFCSTARTTAEKSSPQCEKKRLSSAAKKISMACCGIAESGVNSRRTPPSSASTCTNVPRLS